VRGPRSAGRIPVFGVDTMLFVYHFEENRRFGADAARLLTAAENGRCRLVTSALAVLEVLVVPKREGRDGLCPRYRDLFQFFPNLEVVALDAAVAELAAGLRAARDLPTPDAIHLATAIHAGVDAFVTEDRRLGRATEVAVVSLAEAVRRARG
jgi:predicted nucleic acid-binding protein